MCGHYLPTDGAFKYIEWAKWPVRNDGEPDYAYIEFDMSRVSNVYKDNVETVQPPAMIVNYYIKAK